MKGGNNHVLAQPAVANEKGINEAECSFLGKDEPQINIYGRYRVIKSCLLVEVGKVKESDKSSVGVTTSRRDTLRYRFTAYRDKKKCIFKEVCHRRRREEARGRGGGRQLILTEPLPIINNDRRQRGGGGPLARPPVPLAPTSSLSSWHTDFTISWFRPGGTPQPFFAYSRTHVELKNANRRGSTSTDWRRGVERRRDERLARSGRASRARYGDGRWVRTCGWRAGAGIHWAAKGRRTLPAMSGARARGGLVGRAPVQGCSPTSDWLATGGGRPANVGGTSPLYGRPRRCRIDARPTLPFSGRAVLPRQHADGRRFRRVAATDGRRVVGTGGGRSGNAAPPRSSARLPASPASDTNSH